jgi:hypothetical protein
MKIQMLIQHIHELKKNKNCPTFTRKKLKKKKIVKKSYLPYTRTKNMKEKKME